MDIAYTTPAFHPQPGRASTTDIPLNCNICPKKPKFSDVSHLLTHIASKAHLSTYYKIKVRSAQEAASRSLIDEYDVWYTDNGIEDLMSERLNLKEQKRKMKAQQKADNKTSKLASTELPASFDLSTVPVRTRRVDDVNRTHPDSVEQRPMLPYDFGKVDPELYHDSIKQELDDAHGVVPSIEYDSQYEVPPWMPWASNHHQPDPYTFDNGLPTPDSFPETPKSRHLVFLEGIEEAAAPSNEGETQHNDSTLLKGIIWPGMDLFDSATPEMRRKRNQKKSLDVVDRLQATSNMIEATEVVYTPEIIESKARAITGLPHSSVSPFKKAAAPPAKKVRVSSAAGRSLAVQDASIPPLKRRARTSSARTTVANGTGKPKRGRKPKAATTPALEIGTSPEKVFKEVETPVQVAANVLAVLNSPFSYVAPSGDTAASTFRTAPRYYTDHETHRPGPEPLRANDSFNSYGGNNSTSAFANPFYNPFNFQYTPASSDSTSLPSWDFMSQDLATILANPSFLHSSHPGDDDDDERTISAPLSEQ
ncbi:hypothetical protein BDZ85DRAFT_283303 [Elsinoe ampelina]|uniref:Uncharacterized protein n=1 Tax=Elsinoe ampelina TaxID=302913 RepID=A0A6A6G8U8_9PEZI|nr:hypothetical protein BDZ85DRAFT_283303 [Elsinoe ampelina]